MTEATRASERDTAYANAQDFCRIFAEDMSSLYLLSFLLTADHEKAEQCFVTGLEDSTEGRPVFKEWARSWARRTIIQNAVRAIAPRPSGGTDWSSALPRDSGRTAPVVGAEVSAILGLRPFERFVFVMSVLEHYSDQDCSVLLGCTRRDVITARVRALQQIGSSRASSFGLRASGAGIRVSDFGSGFESPGL